MQERVRRRVRSLVISQAVMLHSIMVVAAERRVTEQTDVLEIESACKLHWGDII